MSPFVSIYALIDPRNKAVRYVGQSNNINQRISQHLSYRWDGNIRKCKWMDELRSAGLEPEVKILETCGDIDADEAERRHIRSFLDMGADLLNICDGGRARTVTRAAHATIAQWIQLGNKIKAIEEILNGCMLDAAKMMGSRGYELLKDVDRKLDRAKSKFDGEVCNRRRGWENAPKVFYGRPLEITDDSEGCDIDGKPIKSQAKFGSECVQ